jgi:arginine/lysine/ornithine decarboxylase
MNADADICVVSVHKMGAGFEQGSVFHVRGDLVDADHLSSCADLLMTTSPNVMVYAAIDGWRRHMVASGTELLGGALDLARAVRNQIDGLPGLSVMEKKLLRKEASHDLDRLQVLVDVSELGVSGYQVADWLRDSHAIDVGLSDHRRILATLSMADDALTTDRLVRALAELVKVARSFDPPIQVEWPEPGEFELETVILPRDAFFGPKQPVNAAEARGRISAEQVTPYPPGIPTLVPGERITQPVVDYLRSGLAAGMVIPDATDPSLDTFLVVA